MNMDMNEIDEFFYTEEESKKIRKEITGKKYRKKPVGVEAIQFTRDNFKEVEEFTNGKASYIRIERCINGKAYCTIETLEGNMTAIEGDYIIKGIKGEFYPCKPDIFEKSYERV